MHSKLLHRRRCSFLLCPLHRKTASVSNLPICSNSSITRLRSLLLNLSSRHELPRSGGPRRGHRLPGGPLRDLPAQDGIVSRVWSAAAGTAAYTRLLLLVFSQQPPPTRLEVHTHLPPWSPTPVPPHVCSTLKAIRMQESSQGRRLTPQERQELMRDPAKLLRTLLGPLGVLYSGLKPAAIETAASQAVSDLRQQRDSHGGESAPNARSHPPRCVTALNTVCRARYTFTSTACCAPRW